MLLFDLHSCILSILILIIPKNADTLITLYFYVCRWKLKKRKKIEVVNKTFNQITKIMQMARALTTIPTKSDDPYILDVNASFYIFQNNC